MDNNTQVDHGIESVIDKTDVDKHGRTKNTPSCIKQSKKILKHFVTLKAFMLAFSIMDKRDMHCEIARFFKNLIALGTFIDASSFMDSRDLFCSISSLSESLFALRTFVFTNSLMESRDMFFDTARFSESFAA